ncbi:hypothetical protein ACHAW6_012725 [Cyclotella cf. meneghiniana]
MKCKSRLYKAEVHPNGIPTVTAIATTISATGHIPLKPCHLVNLLKTTPVCTNPQNLITTGLLNKGGNISFLQTGSPADLTQLQTSPKFAMQPKGSIETTENLFLLLNMLKDQVSYQATRISNNLLAASGLADTGCELISHGAGRKVITNGEILL